MKIEINVKTGCKKAEIAKIGEGVFRVCLKARPVENAANFELIEQLAEFFRVPKCSITVLTGLKSKHKIVEIL